MEHLNMQTPDGAQLNLDALYQICPSCFTESADAEGKLRRAVNWNKLRELLGDYAEENAPESYDFTWVGKRAAQREAAAPINKTLRPCPEESVDWENTQNLYIEGDNLEVLKLLQNSYMGKVKMIYIDPPYNTGNDFVYHDDFAVSAEEYDENNINEEGERFRKNTDSNGRFHSDWCSMMYARLMVSRSLLTEDGVIFISIDDNEERNLKNICDEIFGEDNLVANIVWEQGKKSMAAQIAVNHEYCLVYAKNREVNIINSSCSNYHYWRTIKQGLEPIYEEYNSLKQKYGDDFTQIEKEIKKFFKSLPNSHPSKSSSHYSRVDKKGLFFADNISQGTGKGGRFEIIHPITGKPCKIPGGGWRFSINKLPELLHEDRIFFGPDESNVPCLKRYLKETEYEVMASVIYKDGRGASKRLESLFDVKGIFPFPKDENVIKTFISIACKEGDIVLDYFSGSASTAHAIINLNCEDGRNRKFIMIQLQEDTEKDSEAAKAGYSNICEIGKERIRRAGAKIKAENPNVDTGFRVFKCDSSNMKEVYFHPKDYSQDLLAGLEDNIKEDRRDLDLLFDCMLRWGVELSLPLSQKKVGDCTIHNVNDGDLVACFDGKITETVIDEIAAMNPLRVVFRDSSFEEASEKMNLFELFKQKCQWSEQEVKNNVRVI